MEKTYSPQTIEQRWYDTWEQRGYFAPAHTEPGLGTPYSIMIPPPNVTGSLHMGHAFQDTLMDALIRYHRMQGDNTLWQVGTDHAGIATQMVVERQLAAQGISRHDLGRDKFLEKVWAWKAESGGTITRQLRRMGASVDWSKERFTMDEGLSRAVQEAFVRLHDEGLIYRGKRLVNWDPALHTAISDLEVVSEEEQGSMWHFRYPLADGSGHLVVATTRPETMLGDSAVAVHPEDERYSHLIGKTIRLPITAREIPIIGDTYVDPAFGTGCVKITPAHDFNDYEVGKRHNLPLINVFDKNAHVLREFSVLTFEGYAGAHGQKAPPSYAGLERFAARKQIVAEMEQLGLLEKIDAHTLKVPRGDRSGVIIEPWLTDQWYVDAKTLAKPAIEAVESGAIRFVPQQYENLYFSWMRDIQDWCISRQLWWGHRIPAWYGEKGRVFVARNYQEAFLKYLDFLLDEGLINATQQEYWRIRHDNDEALCNHELVELGIAPLRQDEDVLDTWFSSALWTFSTLGWPENTPALQTFHPSSVLVTGFDIIFFWVARMIMMTMHLVKHPDGSPQVPFKTVYVHGLVRDAEGQKMSKSKGNVLDPLDLIDGIELEPLVQKRTSGLMKPQDAPKIEARTRKEFPDGIAAYGCDALRFTFASLASTGRDIKFDMGRVEGYRNFCNKLWNAARYVLMNTEGQDCGQNTAISGSLSPRDKAAGSGFGFTRRAVGRIADCQRAGVRVENNAQTLTYSLADRWIRSRLQHVIAETRSAIDSYRFDLAAQAIYEFTWNAYCDWYLEAAKIALQTGDAAQQRGTRQTLVQVLETLLRLAHPIMPYITEEIWQRVAPLTLPLPLGQIRRERIWIHPEGSRQDSRLSEGRGEGCSGATLMQQPYPVVDSAWQDAACEEEMAWSMAFILELRRIRGEMDIAPSKPLPVLLQNGAAEDRSRLERNTTLISRLGRVESCRWLAENETPPQSAMALVGDMKLLIPMAGLIDKTAELARLDKEIQRLTKELPRLEGKLTNPAFIDKAPAEVVEKERAKLADLRGNLAELEAQVVRIRAL